MFLQLKSPLPLALLLVGLPATRAAERLPRSGELAAIFQPFTVEYATLAPDGRHLAYLARDGNRATFIVVDVDDPVKKASFDPGQSPGQGFFSRRGVRVSFLRWTGSERLVYGISAGDEGEVRTVGRDGKGDRPVVTPESVAEYWVPLRAPVANPDGEPPEPESEQVIPRAVRLAGFPPDDPDAVFIEAYGGRTVRSEVYRVSLASGKMQSLNKEEAEGQFLYDQQGHVRLMETPFLDAGQAGGRSGRGRGGRGGGGGGRGKGAKMTAAPSPIYVPQIFRVRNTKTGLLERDWRDLDSALGFEPALNFRVSADTYYGARSFPLTFGADPDILYFASNIGRPTYGIYALNLATKQRTSFAIEDPVFDLADPGDAFADGAFIFDRQRHLEGVRLAGPRGGTRWLDPQLEQLQQKLDADFRGRFVDIREWDDSRRRFLILVSGPADPGRFYIHEPAAAGRLTEYIKRSTLGADEIHRSVAFEFDTPAGVHLTGTLTLPRRTRINPPPLVLICRDIPGRVQWAGFNRDTQAIAAMGFAVATVNYRGTAGFGARHRDAVKDGYDRVPVEDLRATVTWLAEKYPVNSKRVGLIGDGFGGFIALRAVQMFPDEFRCAVTINAPTEPVAWIRQATAAGFDLTGPIRRAFFEEAKLAGLSVLSHVADNGRPTLIIRDTGRRDLAESQGTNLRDALKKHGLDVEHVEVPPAATGAEPTARAKIFTEISAFLNTNIYDYKVDLGEAKEVR